VGNIGDSLINTPTGYNSYKCWIMQLSEKIANLVFQRRHNLTLMVMQLLQTARLEKRKNLLPAGGTTWSSNFMLVLFQIFFITDLSSSFAWSIFPIMKKPKN